ncbi:MAG: precorrin-2 dehydrogenase/sirohydrochlorin ferrochelatase family protein [Thermodesulforhabdaceae bacterium]|jgi:precorrin-2 dehydrogenase/sirohydrochlorin ferrochelatase
MYPICLKLEGVKCLVVGGGRVGERKARKLVEQKAIVYLVSRDATGWFYDAIKNGQVVWVAKEYSEECLLDDISLVFAATSDDELNSRIVRDALKKGLWCNSATNPYEGNFIVPASFSRGKLTIAVSTDGASPALAALIKDAIAEEFNARWGEALECLDVLRKAIQTVTARSDDNLQIFREIAGVVFNSLRERTDIETMKNRIDLILSLNFSLEELEKLRQVLEKC